MANQKVAVVSYRGTENNTEQYYRYVSFDGAFVNNMVLIPYFKSDWKTGEYFPQFAETSGNLYVQSDATQFYPFITNPIKPNLAPTSAALGTFVSDPNADQRQVYE